MAISASMLLKVGIFVEYASKKPLLNKLFDRRYYILFSYPLVFGGVFFQRNFDLKLSFDRHSYETIWRILYILQLFTDDEAITELFFYLLKVYGSFGECFVMRSSSQ